MQKKLSKKLTEQFAQLLEDHSPRQLSSGLRDILLDYMATTINTGFPAVRSLLFFKTIKTNKIIGGYAYS